MFAELTGKILDILADVLREVTSQLNRRAIRTGSSDVDLPLGFANDFVPTTP